MIFDSTHTQKKPAHQLFEQMAVRFPNHTALVFGHKTWTYAHLNQQANQLAHCLLSSGIGSESLLGICMHRSPELIVSILAIWKAGAAYLPLDPEYPQDRLNFMMQDAGLKLILSRMDCQSDKSPLEHFSGKVLLWEEFLGHSFLFSDQNPNLQTALSDLAYVIYTSGSTGKPKGVLLEHRGLANLIPAQTQRFGVTPDSRFLQFASLSFDTSLWEVLLPLTSGATLVLATAEQLLLDLPLAHTLKAFRITHFTAPPSVLALLNPSDFPDLQVVVSGGEALRKEIALRWAKVCTLFNAYGPTEATIEVSASLIQHNTDRIAIGKPLPNTRFYILDQQGQQLPIGIPGELHVSGDGLARGYLNRPELTAEKFVTNPFAPGERMYRTGDLARWLPNGEVEHLGRIDQQVKLRGFRIELGEVESALLAFSDLKDAVVTVRQNTNGEDFLCAYYICDQEKPTEALRAFLALSLPEYMIPARFMHLNQFPLTPNGKVDRKALPDPGETFTTGAEFLAPESELEEAIISIWALTLGIKAETIGMGDDFFVLGGNSLKAISLLGQIQKQFKTQIPVHVLYQNPRPKSLSTYLGEVKNEPRLNDSHLISLQPHGSKTPLFIAPEIEGKSYYLFELANAIAKDQPVFGFQQVGFLEDEEPFETIQEIAAFNIRLMKKVQAHGPYQLAGHSMGGWVVMEMANQLRRQGESVEFLGLIDSYSPKVIADLGGFPVHSRENELNDLLLLIERLVESQWENVDYEVLKEKLLQTDESERTSLVHRWSVENDLIPFSFSEKELERWAKLISTNSRISYKPKKAAHPTTLFKAASNDLDSLAIPYCLGWSAKVKSNLRIMYSPGNHFSMMQLPHVSFLAKAIQECLEGKEVESDYLMKA